MTTEQVATATEAKIKRICRRVAKDALASVQEAAENWVAENGNLDECCIYLYVRRDGSWIIDAPDYLQDHRNIVAAVSIGQYASAVELAEAIDYAWG